MESLSMNDRVALGMGRMLIRIEELTIQNEALRAEVAEALKLVERPRRKYTRKPTGATERQRDASP